MRADIAYANDCLSAWASWVRGVERAWPARTLLGRIIDQGISGASQDGCVETMPEMVLRTDQAVARIDPILSQVIRVYYLTHGLSEEKAKQCHCSRATFWRRVERGQLAVYQRLDSETRESQYQAHLQMVAL
jgi:hypothetical protein